MENPRLYPVIDDRNLPDDEAHVFLGFLENMGNMQGIVDGYDAAISEILKILANRVYTLGYPNNGNEPLILVWKDPRVTAPTKNPIELLEKGTGTYGISLYATPVLTFGNTKTTLSEIHIGDIPVPLGSIYDTTGLNSETMIKAGRDPKGPKGVFPVGGKNRTFNGQENLASSTILVYYKDINLDPKSLVSSYTTESKFAMTAMYSLFFDNGRILRFDNFRGWSSGAKGESINVLDGFTLLGYDENKEPLADFLVKFTRKEWREKVRAALAPSVNSYYNHLVEPTEEGQPDHLITAVKRIRNEDDYKSLKRSRYESLFKADLYTNIQNSPDGIATKMAVLARQIIRLVEVDLGLTPQDDRNSYKNKRIKTPGSAILHFFNLSMDEVLKSFYSKYSPTLQPERLALLLADRKITQDYEHAFETSWNPKGRTSMKPSNYTELLKNNQFVLQHTHVTKVVRGRDPNSKNFTIRAVQSTQAPFVDYSETPENGNVGLNNVKSSGCYFSIHNDINNIINTINKTKINGKPAVLWREFTRDNNRDSILCTNGVLQGTCNGDGLSKELRRMRRLGIIPRDIGIRYDAADGYLYIRSDSGRLMVPLFLVEHNSEKIPELVADKKGYGIDKFVEGVVTIDDWRNIGAIDLLDSSELEAEYACVGLKQMKENVEKLIDIRKKITMLRNSLNSIDLYVSLDDEYSLVTKEEKAASIASKLKSLNYNLADAIENRETLLSSIAELDSQRDILSYEDQREDLLGQLERTNANITKYSTRVSVLVEELSAPKSLSREDIEKILTRAIQEERIAEAICSFRYCLPDPVMIEGITTTLLPLHNQNPGPRQTFACKMIKQTMVLPSHSQRWAPVATKYTTMNARGPVETITYDYLGLNTHPVGIPVQLIMYVGQNTVEDMIVASRTFIESGATNCVISKIVTKKIPTSGVRELRGNVETIVRVTKDLPKEITSKKKKGIYNNLGPDGLVVVGSVLRDGDCIIGAYVQISKSDGSVDYNDISRYVKKNKLGVVKDVTAIKSPDGSTSVSIHINENSIAEIGDKWSNPHAQKATIGEILEPWEMPRSMKDGSIPDIMANSHCFPSRMTVGFLREILMGRVHSLTGVQYDGTAFHDHLSIEESMRLLEEYGWSSTGKEDYYMPKTGKIIQAQVFSGFCHYYPLEHKAQPKLQVRYIGKSNARTHQSVTGIENGGGQREGHMEHDVIRTHGASDIIVQWATRASDYYVIYTCAKCDTQIYPHRIDNVTVFMCPECQASVKDVKYAPCCVVTECLRKYSENMGCHLSYVLRPKASLYLPTLTDNIREKK